MPKALHIPRLLLAALSTCCLLALVSLPSRVRASEPDEEEDYYKLLGISRTASEREIKKAFRKLAMEYHPDKNPDPESRNKFEKIANAYDVLSDKKKRKHYDAFGSQATGQQDSPFDFDAFFRPGGDSGFNHHTHFNFHSMFEDLFNDDNFFRAGFGDFFQESHHHQHHQHHEHAEHESSYYAREMGDRQHHGGGGNEEDLFDGFGDFFGGGGDMHMEFGASDGFGGQTCKTVTKRVGNTITSHTTCT